jgi:hypothetical protein
MATTNIPDKYTTFDKKAQAHGWRKGVHKVPKWTKVGWSWSWACELVLLFALQLEILSRDQLRTVSA